MAAATRYSLVINGIEHACVEAGSGPLLLLSHGTFGGKELLLPQLDDLASAFRCVAFDWRGHGGTGYTGRWTHADLVRDLRALIAALGEKAAFLAGVSQGGAVSTRLALSNPDAVLGLVNMCAGPGPPPAAGLERMRSFAARLAQEPDEKARRAAARDFSAAVFHAPGFPGRDPAGFAAEIGVMLAHDRRAVPMLPDVPAGYDDILPQLGRLACPTLVIWGEQDGRPEMGRIMADHMPRGELMMVADAGHHVNVDAPQACADAILSFLCRHINGD